MKTTNNYRRQKFDAVVLAVAHKEFLEMELDAFKNDKAVVYDVKGGLGEKELKVLKKIYGIGKQKNFNHWRCWIYRFTCSGLFVNKYPDYQIVNLDTLTYAGNFENLKDLEIATIIPLLKGI